METMKIRAKQLRSGDVFQGEEVDCVNCGRKRVRIRFLRSGRKNHINLAGSAVVEVVRLVDVRLRS